MMSKLAEKNPVLKVSIEDLSVVTSNVDVSNGVDNDTP